MSLTIRKNVLIALGAPALFALGAASATALAPSVSVVPLFEATKTVVGEPIAYPVGAPAKITAAIVNLSPGAATGWHKHGIPVIGMIMEGELTVDYGPQGKRTFKPGDAFPEAINETHQGTNTGAVMTKLLAIYLGAEGLPNSIAEKAPE
ncbi:cupin domain-containing protein [Hyphomicrobium sp.]|uniref:cupin domain-containing protein n=1 Tax=Hyphomicrobium sp. TaxID=82 RepID=UPI002D76D425|nr:cupin domain-containing protein [Hyphomicrobium sp.]HET6390917.1 cupin domain-containing protein [Hyphomicrobium sp.]